MALTKVEIVNSIADQIGYHQKSIIRNSRNPP